jgi:HNH endonuclease
LGVIRKEMLECDLLDAAAAFARVPLLALVVVREASGEVNRNAWKTSQHRDAIIAYSSKYKFDSSDFSAIKRSLASLDGMGNRAAWKWVRSRIPRNELLANLTGLSFSPISDAINDIGSDIVEPTHGSVVHYPRDATVRARVFQRAAGKCELCGKQGFKRADGSHYLESHHIIALANEGADRMTNVIALCANDHREAHFGRRRKHLETRMISIVRGLEESHSQQAPS